MLGRPAAILSLLGSFALVGAGCASSHNAPVAGPAGPPRVAASVRHEPGSPLSGDSTAQVETATPTSALQVLGSFLSLDRIPEDLLGPLSAHARVILETAGDRAPATRPSLFTGARAGSVADAEAFLRLFEGRAQDLADLRGALPRGVTATFEIEGEARTKDERAHERVRLHVHRRGDDPAVEIAVELAGVASPAGFAGELVAFDPTKLGRGEGFAVIARSPFSGERPGAILVLARVAPPPAEDAPGAAAHRTACVQCNADIAREAVLVRELASRDGATSPPRPDMNEAIRALGKTDSRRASIFLLAQAGSAPLAEDLALSASDRVLGPVCASVERMANAPGAPTGGRELGWLVERAAIEGLQDLARTGTLPPETEVALARRCGAAALSLGSLFGLVEGCKSLDEFEDRLRLENVDLLDDSSPSTRVRAFDWLTARGVAPPGYDPLAPAPVRRVALDRAAALERAKRGTP